MAGVHLVDNRAMTGSGGSVYVGAGANVVATNVTASSSSAALGSGGGFYVATAGALSVHSSDVKANNAARGGGIACAGGGVWQCPQAA